VVPSLTSDFLTVPLLLHQHQWYYARMSKAATVNRRTGKTKQSPTVISMMDKEARLAAWDRIRGMWKNSKPDPIKELAKMRREWARKLP